MFQKNLSIALLTTLFFVPTLMLADNSPDPVQQTDAKIQAVDSAANPKTNAPVITDAASNLENALTVEQESTNIKNAPTPPDDSNPQGGPVEGSSDADNVTDDGTNMVNPATGKPVNPKTSKPTLGAVFKAGA